MQQIIITLTSSNGSVTRKVMAKPDGKPVQLDVPAGTKVDVQVQGPAKGKPEGQAALDANDLQLKQVGSDLVIEGGGESLVEITDFYATSNASLGSVNWDYAEPIFADVAATSLEGRALAAVATNAYSIPVVIGVGAVGVAALGGGGGGGGGGAIASGSITGQLTAGQPIGNNGLLVKAYTASGNLIGASSVDVGTGRFTIDIGSYTGRVFLQVTDTDDATPDYRDEASRLNIDLTADLLAYDTVGAGDTVVNINPLTTIAAKMAGLTSTSGVLNFGAFNGNSTANEDVAAAFGLSGGLTKLSVVTSVDASGAPQTPNSIGALLAALSGMDALNGDMSTTINNIIAGISNGKLSDAQQLELFKGAAIADPTNSMGILNLISDVMVTVSNVGGFSINDVATDNVIDVNDAGLVANGAVTASWQIGGTVAVGTLAQDVGLSFGGAPANGTVVVNGTTWTYTVVAGDISGDGPVPIELIVGGEFKASRIIYVNATDNNPLSVTFANAVANLAENTPNTTGIKVADIIIADSDGYHSGTPTPSNINDFEVRVTSTGNYELWLKPGISRDYEAPSTLTTTVTAGGVVGTYTLNVTNVNEAPTIANVIADQTFVVGGVADSFTFASNVFNDEDANTTLTYTATLADGGALPSWLSFDAASRTFSGNPTASGVTSVKVIASDGALSISDTFDINAVTVPVVQSFTVTDSATANGANRGKSGETLTFVVTLSESVTTTGSLTAVFSVNGTNVTAISSAVSGVSTITFTGASVPGTGNGTAISLTSLTSTAAITGDAYQQPLVAPTAGAVTTSAYTVDNAVPTLNTAVISGVDGSGLAKTTTLIAGDKVKVVLTSDEVLVGLTTADKVLLTFGGQQRDAFYVSSSGNSHAFIYTIQPNDLANVVVSLGSLVLAGVVTDAVGNTFTPTLPTATGSVLVDAVAPALTITDNVTGVANSAMLFTFSFSEDVVGFDVSKIAVSGGTAGAFNTVNARTYTVVVTPDTNSTTALNVSVAAGAAADLSGNTLTAPVSVTQAVNTTIAVPADSTAPTLTITDNVSGTATGPVAFTFSFSEDVVGFDVSKITVTGGTAGAFNAINARTYTVVVTPDTNSTTALNVSVAAGATSDMAGNALATQVTATQAVDTTVSAPADTAAPTLTITDNLTSATATGDVLFTFTFSEAVVGFDVNKVNVINGIKGTFTAVSTNTYTLVVTPNSDATGNLSVSVAAGGATDLANLALSAPATSRNVAFDTTSMLWSVEPQQAQVNEGAGSALFLVTRSGATGAANVQFTTGGGSATAGSDYTAVTQTLSFGAGEMSKFVSVAISDDSNFEANENLVAVISDPTVGNLANASATIILLDNEQSVWSVTAPSTVSEGAGTVTFTITRTGATGAATIGFATGGGTATAGSDFTATSQQLSFLAGEMSKTVTVSITDDMAVESSETMVGNISNASTGSIAASSATVALEDNEQSLWHVSAPGAVSEGAGLVTFTVTRTGADAAATINLTTSAGTATQGATSSTAGADYVGVNQTLNFAKGEMSKTITVELLEDNLFETGESFAGIISQASTGAVLTSTATVTVQDNEQSVWLIEALDSAAESSGQLVWRISRTGSSAQGANIDYAVTSGSATAGTDFTAPTATTLSFAAGETSKLVTLAVTPDTFKELDESITIGISNASIGTFESGRSTATNWILDDDNMLWSLSSLGSVQENAGSVSYTVSRAGSLDAATVTYALVGGNAVQGTHYNLAGLTNGVGTLSFAQGEQSKTISVDILDNTTNGGNRSIVLGVTGVSVGTLTGGNTSTVTIVDNDLVAWSISGPSQTVVESDGATMTFQVRRSGDISVSDTIYYQMGGGTALMGTDFSAVTRTQLSFAAGEEVKSVTINILNDTVLEAGKTITLGIEAPSRGTISNDKASGSLIDDDIGTVWTVASNGNAIEGGVLSFVVTRTGNSASSANVDIGFAGGTANVGGDHAAFGSDPSTWSKQTLNFAAGEMSKVVTIQTTQDTTPESDESVIVVLANPSTGVVGTQGWSNSGSAATAYITDNDSTKWSISGSETYEATGFITYTVTRSGDLTQSNTIDYAISGGSAVVGVNYVALPTGTLTFNEGEVTKTITVAVLDDGVTGVNSTLAMSISNPSVGVLLNQTQNSIIQDGTRSMQWSVNGSGYNIEDAGSAMFTVVRSGDLSTQQTIRFYTENFQATSGLDYTAVDTILTFEAGESVKSVSVSILTDSISETQAEHFLVKIASPSSGVVTSSSAYGPIIDADQAIWQVERFASEVSEGGGGMAFLISRVGATPAASLQYSVVDSNNSNAVITAATTLSFSEGETSKVVYLPLVDNSTVQTVNPKYTVSLSAMTHGIINDNSWATAPSSNWNTIVKDNDQVFLNVYGANSQTQDFRNILPESVAGSPNVAIFRIVRTGNTDVSTTVDFAINSTAPSTQQYTYADGTPYLYGRAMVATGGVDYVALTTNQVSFSAGETVKEIVVQLINDNVAEVHKFINMVISNGSSSNSMTTTLQKTNVNNFIIDDDTPSSGITDDNDTVTNFGGTGVNVINLGAGQDILRLNASQAGGGLFQGGASWATGDYSDELDASAITGSITWQLGAPVAHGGFDGTMTYSGGGIDTFWNFEIFKLGSGANTLTSTGGNASQVHAYAHHQVTLGAGGDTLYIQRDLAGVGGGTFNGGGGTDTLSFANATEGVSVVYSGTGGGTFAATSGTVGLNGAFSSFETLAYGSNVANISVASNLALGGWFVVTGGGASDTVSFANAASGTAVYMDTDAGGAGGDNVTMSVGSDYIYAGTETVAGNDTFNAGSGGYDRLSYENTLSTNALAIMITGKSTQGWDGTVTATAIGTDSFVGFDEVYGGKGTDTFTSSVTTWAGGLAISGYGGNDNFNFSNLTSGTLTIYDTTGHGSGSDSATVGNGAQLNINSGSETVVGNDTWTAGTGTSDSLNYNAATAATTWALTANAGSTGFDGTVTGTSVGTDTFTGFENFTLSGQNETVTVSGARGISLNLGAGNDTFTGGSGVDYVTLGGGNDTVVFKYLSNTVRGGHSEDSVRGFAFTNDTLKFDTAMFTGAVDANNLTNYMRMSTTAGQLHCLQIDRDGTGSTWGWTNFAWFDSPDGTLPITADLTTMFNASRIVIA